MVRSKGQPAGRRVRLEDAGRLELNARNENEECIH